LTPNEKNRRDRKTLDGRREVESLLFYFYNSYRDGLPHHDMPRVAVPMSRVASVLVASPSRSAVSIVGSASA
jgi:hypothetical protein